MTTDDSIPQTLIPNWNYNGLLYMYYSARYSELDGEL